MLYKRPFGDDPQVVRDWKAGFDALNQFELEERKKASYQDRIRSLNLIWQQANFLGFIGSESYDLTVNDIWQRLRTEYRPKNA